MTVWRPQQTIEVKALGLVWRAGRLLASEIYLDDGTVKGVRPLGGKLEFGETWREALVREFDEELNVPIHVIGEPIVLENIYTHHGEIGHEITFVSNVTFPDGAYNGHDPIEYFEDNGEKCVARWYKLTELDVGNLELYPNGLKESLEERALSSEY
ncbi:MAG: NUDIX domain-containing protein [Roseobacter sp.]